ncbi:MAG: glutamate synthase subunit beta [Candidatus Omnitrophica bacterium]|nr:glutamate synthase subunit beta [Candidatus Omnitrophota bacterium]
MAKDIKAFLTKDRKKKEYRSVSERIKDYKDVAVSREHKHSEDQASRCMDCGTPFCHWACPLGNYVPEWNDYVMRGKFKEALRLLMITHNMPEITGRVCPALCEASCVLGINDSPVTICENELAVIEYGFEKGLVRPRKPKARTGKNVAVIGSGPAGLAVADQLNQAGHNVTVYERDDKPGGLLRYGIPDFKLEKKIIDRRINIFKKEGVTFVNNVNVGTDISVTELKDKFDAVCLAIGSRVPRDLSVSGRELNGVYFALDYLIANNRWVSDMTSAKIDAKDKRVVVIGGGDTGSDCVGTANRHGAKEVTQIEVLPKPSETRTAKEPWPVYPKLLKTTTSHEEGCKRDWSVLTKRFIGKNGKLESIDCVKVEFIYDPKTNRDVMKEIPGSEFSIPVDIALLAVGFVHPEHSGLVGDLKLKLDARGNVATGDDYMTSADGIFAAGDARRGQSLVVWALAEGRKAAYHIDKYLMGKSALPVI